MTDKKPKIKIEDIFLNDFDNILKNDSPQIISEIIKKQNEK